MAQPLSHFKKGYRARFFHGEGTKIDVQPGQNVLKVIQDCFESCGSDVTVSSPSATCCPTPIVRKEKRTSARSQRPEAGLTDSAKRECISAEALRISPLRPVSSRGRSHESPVKPAIHDYVADSKKPKSPVSNRATDNILKDVDVLCRSPGMFVDPEDDHESVGSPLAEKVKSSVPVLHLDDQNTPAAMKSHVEGENLEGPQTGRCEQVVVQGTEHTATSSVRKRKSFTAFVSTAVATGAFGRRYSASTSLTSPPPVEDQDTENECEFLIDESDGASSNCWTSIPSKNKKAKKDVSAAPVSKSQPSEKPSASLPSPPPVKDRDSENEGEFLIDESDGASSNCWTSIPSKNKKAKKDVSATPVSKSQPSEKPSTSLPSPPPVKDRDSENEGEFLIDESDGASSNCWTSIPSKNKKAKKDVSAAPVSKSQPSEKPSTSLPAPPPVKDRDTENEGEFLIDESDGEPVNRWISIPSKNKKAKKDVSATPVSKSQPSEKEKTGSKKGKNRKVQVKALTKQKMDGLDVIIHDFERTSESDPVSKSEGIVLKSQKQNSTGRGKTKKDALKQGFPNQEKDTSWKPEAEELMSQSGLEMKASDKKRSKSRVMPSEDSLVPSAGHQQEQTASQKKNLKSPKQSASKAPQHLGHKKQTAKQKISKGTVAKRQAESSRKKFKNSGQKSSNKKPRLQRVESSDSEPGEEELEVEPVKLDQVFPSPLHQELQTSVIQKLAKSDKPENSLHTLESVGRAKSKTPVRALRHVTDGVENSQKKQLSAKSSRKMPKKINRRNSKGVCSDAGDAEFQADFDSSPVQDVAGKKQQLPDTKIKSNRRKRNTQREQQHPFAVEETVSHESGPVLKYCGKSASRRKSVEHNYTSSDISEDLNYVIRDVFSNSAAKHKIVLPSNTPNVRRTKRIRLKPLEYWRGERVNYTVAPSGSLVISEIVCPEKEPPRNIRQKKHGRKQERGERRSEMPSSLYHTLADTSKPTIVVDPETNEEVLLECVNTESGHSCFFKNESVEIYKNLNTSDFATGRLILKPLKEKGHQSVHMDTIVFHVIHGKIIVTLHKTSYYLTTGDFFYVPAGNGYNIHNLLNEESVLLFTQMKRGS
ncbi:centromere protein C [Aegotheles albertisi]